jgi:hypothetical protein
MTRAIRSLIARAKRQEREHVRAVKWYLKHGDYVRAAQALAWADTLVATRADFPKRRRS